MTDTSQACMKINSSNPGPLLPTSQLSHGVCKWVDWEPGKIEGCWNITLKLRTIKARTDSRWGVRQTQIRCDVRKMPLSSYFKYHPRKGCLREKLPDWAKNQAQKCGAVFLQLPPNHGKVFSTHGKMSHCDFLLLLMQLHSHTEKGEEVQLLPSPCTWGTDCAYFSLTLMCHDTFFFFLEKKKKKNYFLLQSFWVTP